MKTGLLTVQPLTHIAGGDATALPYNNLTNGSFEAFTPTLQSPSTTLLLHMDGTNASTAFLDSSSRANPVTAGGDAQLSTAVKKFGTASGKFDGTGDYLSIPSDQKLTNGSFEAWTDATVVNPSFEDATITTAWTLTDYGTGATWARTNAEAKAGTYSGILTRGTSSCVFTQDIYNVAYRSKSLTCGMWVKSSNSVAGQVKLIFSADGTSPPTATTLYQNSGGWEFLTATITVPANATAIQIAGLVDAAANAAAYYDGCTVTIYSPTGWTLNGIGAMVAREEGTIKVGTYSAKVTAAAADSDIGQDLWTALGGGTTPRGKTVTWGAWVWCNTASKARLYFYESTPVTASYSSYHTGNSTWQYLTLTITINATGIDLYAKHSVGINTTAYFDGAFVTDDAAANFNFGSGDFTIDTWWRTTDEATSDICSQYENSGNYWRLGYNTSTGLKFFAINGGTAVASYDASWTALVDTFYHIEFERTTTTAKAFINGVALSLTETTAFGTQSLKNIDAIAMIGSLNGGSLLNGYIDEFRVSKGVARHTAAFTPQTIAYGQKPTGWTLGGANAECDIDTDVVKIGTCSAKLTRNGTNAVLTQDITTASGRNLAYWKGRTVTLGAWVYATVVGYAQVDIYDGATESYAYNTTGTGWQYITATLTVSLSASFVKILCSVLTTNTTAYFDGAMVNEGSQPYAFQEKPLLLTSAGDAALPGHLIGGDGTTSPNNVLTNGSFETFTAGYAQTGGPTTLLLHMDGANDTEVLTDSSGRGNVVTNVGNAKLKTAVKQFGTASLLLNGTTQYATVPSDQKLSNGSFQTWTGLTDICVNGDMEDGSPPSTWFLQGADATWARESTIIKGGTYSGKLTRAGTDCDVVQTITVSADTKTYVFGAWVYQAAGAGNRAAIYASFSVGGNTGLKYHSGAVGWEYLSVSLSNTNNTDFNVFLFLKNTDGSAYFDSAVAYEQLAPTSWTLAGAGATVAREEGTIKVGTYSAKLTRSGTDCGLLQTVSADGIAYRGKTVTIGCWVWASVAASATIRIVDGISYQYSSAHTGNSTWQYLTVTGTISNSATIFRPELLIITNDTTAYFDGAFVTDDAAANFNFGSGDWTIDTLARFSTVAESQGIFSHYKDVDNRIEAYWYQPTSKIYFTAKRAGIFVADYNYSFSPSVDTFYHFEFVRNGSTFYILSNGVSLTLTTETAISTNRMPEVDGTFNIGLVNNGAIYLNGYLDEFRVSKGIARHTANFTPSTIAYGNTPANWTLVGTGAELDIATDIVKVGTYSAQVTPATTGYIYQNVSTTLGGVASRGKSVTFGCWVYATVAGKVRIEIQDGGPGGQSSWHTGVPGWQYLTTTCVIDASATLIYAVCYSGDASAAYFDGAMVNEGSMPYAFSEPKPDYIEGMWTPGITFGGSSVGVVYHVNNGGRYIKIGKMVWCSGHFIITSNGSSVGAAVITGLPFVSANPTYTGGCFGYFSGVSFTNVPLLEVSQATTTMPLYEVTTGGVLTALTDADVSDNANITFSVVYSI